MKEAVVLRNSLTARSQMVRGDWWSRVWISLRSLAL